MRRLNKSELLEGIENVKASRLITYNTVEYIIAGDSKTYIRFYDTDIIIFHSDYVVLNSGGHETATTKNRINEFQNVCYINRIDFQWFVKTVKGIIRFYDGMKISNDGVFIN